MDIDTTDVKHGSSSSTTAGDKTNGEKTTPTFKKRKTNDGKVASVVQQMSAPYKVDDTITVQEYVTRLVDAVKNVDVRVPRSSILLKEEDIPCFDYVPWRVLLVPHGSQRLIDAKIKVGLPGIYEIGVATLENGVYNIDPTYCGSTNKLRYRLFCHARTAKSSSSKPLALSAVKINEALESGKTIVYRCWMLPHRCIRFVESLLLFAFRYPWNEFGNSESDIPRAPEDVPLHNIGRRILRRASEDFINALKTNVAIYGTNWTHMITLEAFKSCNASYLKYNWKHFCRKHSETATQILDTFSKTDRALESKEFKLVGRTWSTEDDKALADAYVKHGSFWSGMSKDHGSGLENRPESTLSKRWETLSRTNPQLVKSAREMHEKSHHIVTIETGIQLQASTHQVNARARFVVLALHFAQTNGVASREFREQFEYNATNATWFRILNAETPTTYEFLSSDIKLESGWYEMGVVRSKHQTDCTYVGSARELQRRITKYGSHGDGNRAIAGQLQGLITPVNETLPGLDVVMRWNYCDHDVARIIEAIHLFAFDYAYNTHANVDAKGSMHPTAVRTHPPGYESRPMGIRRTLAHIPGSIYRPFARDPWSKAEEDALQKGVETYGQKWVRILRAYPETFKSRSADILKAHFLRVPKKYRFSEADDASIRLGLSQFTQKDQKDRWTKIKETYPNLAKWNIESLRTRMHWLHQREREGIVDNKRIFVDASKRGKISDSTTVQHARSIIDARDFDPTTIEMRHVRLPDQTLRVARGRSLLARAAEAAAAAARDTVSSSSSITRIV